MRHRIAIVSDFFHPRLGGVELHQYSLAQALLRRGHHVIIITGTFEKESDNQSDHKCMRQGIRYLTNGLKVYHLPHMSVVQQASFPGLVVMAPWFRSIVLTERISIVHGHAATSFLAHECLVHAATMNLHTVYTDHSLFSLHSFQSIMLNKLLQFSLNNVDHLIAVSHCDKENLALRASVHPHDISVIPNAVDCTHARPDRDVVTELAPNSSNDRIVIVVLSRLVYRKGLDLIIPVIPMICQRYKHIDWLIGGDGPKRVALSEMIELHSLQDRVKLLGAIPHDQVTKVLSQGHIFLNCSLTESFCIAILEAVSAGLDVVATSVGGVPEILPHDMLTFAEANTRSIDQALGQCIDKVTKEGLSYEQRLARHRIVREMYNWHEVAKRTELVYNQIITRTPDCLADRMSRLMHCGTWAGPLFAAVAAADALFLKVIEWWIPQSEIDESVDWPQQTDDCEIIN